LPPNGPNIRTAFEALARTLNERGVSYSLVGGLALIQHTRVRTTDDIDVLLAIPQLAFPGLLAHGQNLDLPFVRRELESFTKGDDGRRKKFEAWVRELL
jgi:hypothetical protein